MHANTVPGNLDHIICYGALDIKMNPYELEKPQNKCQKQK